MASGTADLRIYEVTAWAKLCSRFYCPSDLSWIITFSGNIFQLCASITPCIRGIFYTDLCACLINICPPPPLPHTVICLSTLQCQAHGNCSIRICEWMNEWTDPSQRVFPWLFKHFPQTENEAFFIKIITIFPGLKPWQPFKLVTFMHLQLPASCQFLWILPLECLPCLTGIPTASPSRAHQDTHRSGEPSLRWLQSLLSRLDQFPLTIVIIQITDSNY